MNPIIVRMVRSGLVRRAYAACSRIPVLGSFLHVQVMRVLPVGSRIWLRASHGQAQGLWFLADPRFDADYYNGKHEACAQDLLRRELRPGDSFYDVGAHVGFFSLIAARIVGPSGSVTAFEPDFRNSLLFRANRERNKMPHIVLVEAAVWRCSGELKFERSQEASGGMEGHLIEQEIAKTEGPPANESRTLSVVTVSLDDYVYKEGGKLPSFLKIDVEGAEVGVLAGATRLFFDARPRLLCEVHSSEAAPRVEAWLRERHYKFEWFGDNARFPRAVVAHPE